MAMLGEVFDLTQLSFKLNFTNMPKLIFFPDTLIRSRFFLSMLSQLNVTPFSASGILSVTSRQIC